MELLNVPGLANPADLMTKHLGRVDADRHLASLGMQLGGGRAATAPTLGWTGGRRAVNWFNRHQSERRGDQFTGKMTPSEMAWMSAAPIALEEPATVLPWHEREAMVFVGNARGLLGSPDCEGRTGNGFTGS